MCDSVKLSVETQPASKYSLVIGFEATSGEPTLSSAVNCENGSNFRFQPTNNILQCHMTAHGMPSTSYIDREHFYAGVKSKYYTTSKTDLSTST